MFTYKYFFPIGKIDGSRLVFDPPISARVVRLQRRRTLGNGKTYQGSNRTGKEFSYRKRTESESVLGATANRNKQERTFADGSDENFLPIKTPPNLKTSRFKLFTRASSKSPAIKSQDSNIVKEKNKLSENSSSSVTRKDVCTLNLPNGEKNIPSYTEKCSDKGEAVVGDSQLAKDARSQNVITSLKKYLDFTLWPFPLQHLTSRPKPCLNGMHLSPRCQTLPLLNAANPAEQKKSYAAQNLEASGHNQDQKRNVFL